MPLILAGSGLQLMQPSPEGGKFCLKRQDCLLENLIKNQHQDTVFMQFIFDIVSQLSYESRYQIIATFINYNKNFETFKKLCLEPKSSFYPVSDYECISQEHIKYFESLLPLLNTLDTLEHKKYIEGHIQRYRERVKQHKKDNFMERYI